jgi:hypothetical protein
MEAPLRVLASRNRNYINGLIEDDSVFKSFSGGKDEILIYS